MVRHAETDWNRDNRFQGHADPPLNEAGRNQARELAAHLAAESYGALYTSPLRRAHETAQIVGRVLQLEPRVSNALKEVDVGSWSGLTRTEIESRFPEGYRRWLAHSHGWEDGESYADLGRRVVDGLRGIAGAHPGEQVLVVTHGGPIRSALALAEPTHGRAPLPSIGNCSVVRVAIRNGAFQRVD